MGSSDSKRKMPHRPELKVIQENGIIEGHSRLVYSGGNGKPVSPSICKLSATNNNFCVSEPTNTESSDQLTDEDNQANATQRTNQVVALLLKAVQEQRIRQKFQMVGEKPTGKLIRAKPSSLTRSVTHYLEQEVKEEPLLSSSSEAQPPIKPKQSNVFSANTGSNKLRPVRRVTRTTAPLSLDVKSLSSDPADTSCKSTPSTIPAVAKSSASPTRKRARRCGPLACLNEPSIHDTLNLYLLPEATRLAATTALDLCAIRTATTASRRHRVPVSSFSSQSPTCAAAINSSSAGHAKVSTRISGGGSSTFLPVASNVSVSTGSTCSPVGQHVEHDDAEVLVSTRLFTASSQKSLSSLPSKSKLLSDAEIVSPEPCLADFAYYIPNYLTDETSDCHHDSAKKQAEIEVPKCRVLKLREVTKPPISRSGTLLEPLDDEVFAQRHSKGELIEIRRERRERQHLREVALREKWEEKQTQLQAKLRLLTYGFKEPSEPLLPSSLSGALIKIKSVCVRDSVPVMAFSSTVPMISKGEFNLPWLQTPTTSSSTKKRSSRS